MRTPAALRPRTGAPGQVATASAALSRSRLAGTVSVMSLGGSSSLNRFQAVLASSHCPFATASTLLGTPPLSSVANDAAIGAAVGSALRKLASPAGEPWQGVVAEVTDPAAGATVERVAWTVRRVLEALARIDADADASLRRDIEAEEWWFEFAGCELLVLTFAAAYGPEHARHSPSESTFLLFQPHAAFEALRPPGSTEFPRGTKQLIRKAHRDAGRPYDEQLAASKREALKFVKPLKVGDPPVRWWLAADPDAPAGIPR